MPLENPPHQPPGMEYGNRVLLRTFLILAALSFFCLFLAFLSNNDFWIHSRLCSTEAAPLDTDTGFCSDVNGTNAYTPDCLRRSTYRHDGICWYGPGQLDGGHRFEHLADRVNTSNIEVSSVTNCSSNCSSPAGPTSPNSSVVPSPSIAPPEGPAANFVEVLGTGCSVCVAGSTCSFRLKLTSGVYWRYSDLAIRREVMVKIDGPSLLEGASVLLPSSANAIEWLVSYTPFDPGAYIVTIFAECSLPRPVNLSDVDYAKSLEEATNVIAEFNLSVYESLIPMFPPPCEEGFYGRWMPDRDAVNASIYRWSFFHCAREQDRTSFVRAMLRKGISEITFVGDSHNRMLYHHLCYILAGWVDPVERQWHGNLVKYVPLSDGRNFTVRFFWVDGIYQDGPYGCSNRGKFTGLSTFPNLPASTSLYILNAAHWTFLECTDPEAAYARYLPEFLNWGKSLKQVPESRLVWRSATAFNVRNYGCRWGLQPQDPPKGRTNAGLRSANEFAKTAARNAAFQYYDSWQVEAPYYFDNSANDCHFSGITPDGRVVGKVGEAITKHFMTWAATFMH